MGTSCLQETPEYGPWSRGAPYEQQWHWGGGSRQARKLIDVIYSLEIKPSPSKFQKGLSSARADDTKGLKGVILD